MVYYLCGRMTGKEDWGRRDFMDAEEILSVFTSDGDVILNPAILPLGMKREQYLEITFSMVEQADAVVLMEDWHESEGAKKEVELAKKLHKMFFFIPKLMEATEDYVDYVLRSESDENR